MKHKEINHLIHTLKVIKNFEIDNKILEDIKTLDNKLNQKFNFSKLDFNNKYQNELIEKGVPTLKSIYDKLLEMSKFYGDYKVYVNFRTRLNPVIGLCSYRGNFNNVAIEYDTMSFEYNEDDVRELDTRGIYLSSLVQKIENLFNGELLEGYKGGEFRMGYTTPTYVSLEDEFQDIIPVNFKVIEYIGKTKVEIISIEIDWFSE